MHLTLGETGGWASASRPPRDSLGRDGAGRSVAAIAWADQASRAAGDPAGGWPVRHGRSDADGQQRTHPVMGLEPGADDRLDRCIHHPGLGTAVVQTARSSRTDRDRAPDGHVAGGHFGADVPGRVGDLLQVAGVDLGKVVSLP